MTDNRDQHGNKKPSSNKQSSGEHNATPTRKRAGPATNSNAGQGRRRSSIDPVNAPKSGVTEKNVSKTQQRRKSKERLSPSNTGVSAQKQGRHTHSQNLPQSRPESGRKQNLSSIDKSRNQGFRGDSGQERLPGHPNDREEENLRSAPISRIDHLRNVNKKRTLYRAFFLWVLVLLFMVVTAAAILYVTDYVAPKPHYAFVTTGTIEHTLGTSALIIRDESVFKSATEGSLVTMALEGSRVSKDQLVAMVIPDGAESTTESLNQIQMQIAERQRMLLDSGKGSGAQAFFDEADSNMSPIINMIRHDMLTGSMSNLVSYSSSIQVLMDKRDFMMQTVDFSDEELNALHAQKASLENALSLNADDFRAEFPGIVSFKLDGFEGQLSSSMVPTLTPDELEQYLTSTDGSMMSKITIEPNSSVFRICQNAEQYFATILEGYSVTDFPMNSTVDVRVTAEGIVISDCKIIRSIQSSRGVFIILQTNSSVERLLDRRTIEIELIRKSTSGYKVPVSSLIGVDYSTGYAQLMYNASGYARLVTVKVTDYDREYAIIEPAEGFDYPNDSTIIITNPETISEGEKVEQ
jgi:hypothetical protein